jgi:hypothetical protein
LDGNKKSAIVQQQFEPDRYQQQKSVGFDYKKEVQNLFRPDTHQDDSRLINILRNYFIEQPSTEPYNLEHPDRLEFSAGQTPLVDSRLKYIESFNFIKEKSKVYINRYCDFYKVVDMLKTA